DAESWLSGSLAIERGFADALLPADQMKVDENAKAADREVNEIRALEMTLINSGMTRTQARARIKSLKGTHDAAPVPADTPGAGGDDPELKAAMQSLLDDLRA
ncbi:peptidase S14 ClpP, partial [Sphingomonas sp. LH128]|uniref:hypothetical protein n=1 Tax=Sphingomonas sp. LH128 TaxID=473781 RepID=UPI00027CA6D9